MEDSESDSGANSTESIQPPNATKYPFYIPKRPQVVKMRDLSPATKTRMYQEYYEVYDPWTGIRIAASLGILISLFTLFLMYKSKYNKARNTVLTAKKPSLYLYDEDLDGDLDDLGSRDGVHFPFRYEDICRNDVYALEEVLVKPSVVALTVHKHQKGTKGPKYGTLRIKQESSKSLPCTPEKQTKPQTTKVEDYSVADETVVKSACSQSSIFGSITSFSSTESSDGLIKTTVFSKSKTNDGGGSPSDGEESSAKKPLDYRSRRTVVAIGRRRRKS